MITLAMALAIVSPSQRAAPDSEYRALIQTIIETAVDQGNRARPKSPQSTGALLIDAGSLVLHFSMATDSTFTEASIADAIGRPFRDVSSAEAIRCSENDCFIVDDALFITMDGLARNGSSKYQALVNVMWTERRPSGRSATGEMQFRVWLVRSGAKWTSERIEITKQT